MINVSIIQNVYKNHSIQLKRDHNIFYQHSSKITYAFPKSTLRRNPSHSLLLRVISISNLHYNVFFLSFPIALLPSERKYYTPSGIVKDKLTSHAWNI
jgi:hypothetical protein